MLLFYAIETVFQLYLGSDILYEMRRKSKPTLLLTQGIFKLPHHLGMVLEQLAYTSGKWIAAQVNVMAVTGFVPLSPDSPTPCLNQLSYLTHICVYVHICVYINIHVDTYMYIYVAYICSSLH